MILCGDFNFPEEIVKWVDTEDGLIADPSAGNDQRKVALISSRNWQLNSV